MPAAQLYQSQVVLNNAQVKAAHGNNDIELVPAPGEGKSVVFFQCVLSLHKVQPYESIDAGAYIVLTQGAPGGIEYSSYLWNDVGESLTEVSKFLGDAASGDAVAVLVQNQRFDLGGLSGLTQSASSNTGLFLHVGNGQDLTGGDAANQLTITTYYTIIDV